MRNSLKLGTIAGIRIQVHWSFFLLLGWVILTTWIGGGGVLQGAILGAFLLSLFGCVVLHELGHALAARMYNIPTKDITLLPIGGVARLERMPRKPVQEMVVALAGPMVNVVIAAVLFLALATTTGFTSIMTLPSTMESFLARLAWVNVILVVFNLIPAFPLDGGRVFRALLAMVTRYDRATRIAAGTGQVLAVGLALLGLFVLGNPMLLFVAAFIFFGAAAESQSTQMMESLHGYRARDGMTTTFRVLPSHLRLQDVALELLSGSQRDYPVIDEDANEVCGLLTRDDLLGAANSSQLSLTARDLMQTHYAITDADAPLEEAFQSGARSNVTTVVFENDQLAGLLTPEDALRTVMLRRALSRENIQV